MGLFDRLFRRSAPPAQAPEPAPADEGPRDLVLRVSNLQGIGRREGQEDSFALLNASDPEVLAQRGLFAVVCDGMGGMEGGREISEGAVDGFLQLFQALNDEGDVPRQLREGIPGDFKIHTLYDDFLASDPADTGKFSAINHQRLRLDFQACALTGADVIVVSCSTLSPSVRLLRGEVNVPVVAIDDAMVADAVAAGRRIGLLATANSTVGPSSSALQAAAAAAGTEIQLQVLCNEEANRAMKSGDKATHDRLVLELAEQLAPCDVVVLAQASMAHMEAAVAERTGIPVLSSPKRCIAQVREILEKRD